MATYSATVDKSVLAETRNGTPSVRLQFRTGTDLETKKAVENVYFSDLWLTVNAAPYSLKTLKEVFGWNGTSFRELNRPETLRGKSCEITVEPESYTDSNGVSRTRDRVKFINAEGSFENRTIAPLPADAESRFASTYDYLLPGSNAANPDDDLPF